MTYPMDWAWWRFSEEAGEVLASRHVATVPLLVGQADDDARVECGHGGHGHGRNETPLVEYVADNGGAWRNGR